MHEKILSIGIIFCDKDYKYLPRMLQSIDQKVFCPFEVIIVDNRNDKSFDIEEQYLSKYRKIMEIKYLINDKNEGTLAARKQIAYASDGDYLWYTDVDDLIFDTVPPNILESITEDLVIFNYVYQQDGRPFFQNWHHIGWEQTLSIENMKFYDYQVSNWSKWHKVESLRKMWEKYHFEFISAIEDTCLFLAALFTYKTCRLLPYTFYYYNSDISSTNTTNIETADRFYYAVAGFSNACNFIRLVCENNRLKEDAEAIIQERRDWMLIMLLKQNKMPKEEFIKSLNILREEAGHTDEIMKDIIYRKFKEDYWYQDLIVEDNFKTLCSILNLDYNKIIEYLKTFWEQGVHYSNIKESDSPLHFVLLKTCNQKCPYCVNGLEVSKEKFNSKEIAQKLEDALDKWDKLYGLPRVISLTGGEPTLLNPDDFEEVFEKYSNHLFYIYTNGYNLEGWKHFKNVLFELHSIDGLVDPKWFIDLSINRIVYVGFEKDPMLQAWQTLEKCHSKVRAIQAHSENKPNEDSIKKCQSVEGNWIVDLSTGEVAPCWGYKGNLKLGTIENRPSKKDCNCKNCLSSFVNYKLQ